MSEKDRSANQGEGDREAARRYEQDVEEFVDSEQVDKAAENAREHGSDEDQAAERAGKAHAKEVDPAVHRDPRKPTKD